MTQDPIVSQRLAKDALRESRERYEALFEYANDMIYTTDLGLRFTSINAAGQCVTAYTRAEVLGLSLDDLLPEDEKARIHDIVRALLDGSGPTLVSVDIVTKHGRRVPIEVSTRLMTRDGRAVGFQGIARDVSERKSLEAQILQAQKMEAVGRLAGGIAHDFNNLLTVINGYAETLAEEFATDSRPARDLLQIREAGVRAADLTRQLLAFSRRQILTPKTLDLNVVVGGMHRMIGRLIGEDIEFRQKLAAPLKLVTADPGQIEQVIMNLVVNARDAMPHGGRLTIETANVLLDEAYATPQQGSHAGRFVMLSVADDGDGMDTATRSRIFEPFFTTKSEGKGTGLGLSTVFGIVKQSGGHILVDSELGAGTTFRIYLPESKGEPVAGHPPVESRAPVSGHEEILLVEDDPHVREFARVVLAAAGYRVTTAANPYEAEQLDSCRDAAIHLLLTDVVMPGSDGRMLAESLLARHPELKVLYMSGYTTDAIVHHGVLDAAVNFLRKPFSAAALRGKVREVLER